MSLMSVTSINVFAGGLHSWVLLDDLFPKKEEFSVLKGSENEEDEDSLLNSDHYEDIKVD